MFNRIKEIQLIIVLGVLTLILVVPMIAGNSSENRSFMGALTRIDTAAVTSLTLLQSGGEHRIVTRKDGSNWLVTEGEETWNADNQTIRRMLGTLSGLSAKRLAAKDSDRWDNFEVTDSLGTRVQVFAGKKSVADLYIGKFSYTPPPLQGGQPYMQQQQGTMTSYVRLAGEKEVYAVDGYLRMMFNQRAEEFRDRKVLQFDRNRLSRIAFRLPEEQFSLQKSETRWLLDGIMADSAAAAGYLSGIYRLSSSAFLPESKAPAGKATHAVVFEDTLGIKLAEVNACFSDSADIAMTSSMNPGTIFDGTANDLFSKVFRGRTDFMEQK